MVWINIRDEAPKVGQKVIAYFDVFDTIEIYEYEDLEKTNGHFEYGKHCFFNKSGFLTDDITWWMPLPDRPKED